MGVMAVIMVAGLLVFGHHGMMDGHHDKERQKQETMIQHHDKDDPCKDCPADAGDKLEKQGGSVENQEERKQ